MENEYLQDKNLESELRQGPGSEWNAEAAEDEQLTEALRERQSSLADVAANAAQRGQRATAEYEGKMLSGTIVAIGIDYVTLRLGEQDTETRLDSATWTFAATDAAPTEPTRTDMTFRARLEEHVADARRLRIEMGGGLGLSGVIKAVSTDHIKVEDPDGRGTYIPTEMLRAVIFSAVQH